MGQPVPRSAPSNTALFRRGSGQVDVTPPAHHIIVTGSFRHPSRACNCARHPPSARTRRSNCLAGTTPFPRFSGRRRLGPGFAWSYLEHSHQTAAFQSPADSSRHRIPLRPPQSLRGYSCPSPQQSRWLDDHVRAFQACPKLPLRHSFQRHWSADFGGKNTERPLIHPDSSFTDSAPSLLSFTGKGLPPLSSLSFSRSAFYSADTRSLSDSGWSMFFPHRQTPDASVRQTNLSSLTPDWP